MRPRAGLIPFDIDVEHLRINNSLPQQAKFHSAPSLTATWKSSADGIHQSHGVRVVRQIVKCLGLLLPSHRVE
jgi:hypothetical protein